jgi:hypothetical protein
MNTCEEDTVEELMGLVGTARAVAGLRHLRRSSDGASLPGSRLRSKSVKHLVSDPNGVASRIGVGSGQKRPDLHCGLTSSFNSLNGSSPHLLDERLTRRPS